MSPGVHELELKLRVSGPVLVGATQIGALGVDAPILRDHEGRPVIPGTHLLGKIKEALEVLQDAAVPLYPGASSDDAAAQIIDLLGKSSLGLGDARRRIHVGDLVAEQHGQDDGRRTRIARDEVAGAVDEGALQTLETPFRPGEEVVFKGSLRILGPADELDAIARLLRQVLCWVGQVGGERSVGYGRVLGGSLEPANRAVPAVLNGDRSAERWRVLLRLREPFCIALPQRDPNTFQTERRTQRRKAIPGGVLKGVLARMLLAAHGESPTGFAEDRLADRSALARNLATIRVGQLEPCPVTGPLPDVAAWLEHREDPAAAAAPARRWPFSLAFVGEEPFDLALVDGPGLIDGKTPAFLHDWKGPEFIKVGDLFGGKAPQTELRVRAAIDAERRAAKAEALFAYETVIPDKHLWIGELDLADVVDAAERAALLEEIAALAANGISGIGKTDACADLLLRPASARPEPADTDVRGGPPWVVVLRTAALLVNPDLLGPAHPYDAAARLRDAYAETFKELSCGALKLVRHFTWHWLSGGVFQAARYMRGRPYRPWLLTEAGSTFVLEPTGDAENARDVIERWERYGLDIAPNVRAFYGLDAVAPDAKLWRCCPYIRHNGYGAVVVNMPEHFELKPGDGYRKIAVA